MTMRAMPRRRTWPTLTRGLGRPDRGRPTPPSAPARRRRTRLQRDRLGGERSILARTSSMSRSSLLDITSRRQGWGGGRFLFYAGAGNASKPLPLLETAALAIIVAIRWGSRG